MKKLFFTALIAVSISFSSSAQAVNQIDQKAVNNFEAVFIGASNVNWTSKQDLTIASFIQNNHKVEVFYNPDGDLIATTRQIQIKDAPASVKKAVEKKYSDYLVKEVLELKSSDDTNSNYFIAVENDKETIVLKANEGTMSVYSQTKKQSIL